MRRTCLLALIICLGASFCALGQSSPALAAPFTSRPADAQVRDAVLDFEQSGLAFLAVYDKNEVWAIDPATGALVKAIPVGRGPSALAIAPGGGQIACANRLDGTVTLLSTRDGGSVLATIETGSTPSAVTALPGGFIVANAFSDNAVYVAASSSQALLFAANVPVPAHVVNAGGFVVIAEGATPSLHIYPVPGLTGPPRVAPLGSMCQALAAAGGTRVLAVTSSETLLADAATGKTLARAELTGNAVASDGSRHYVVSGTVLIELDDHLETVRRIELNSPAQGLATAKGYFLAVSPKSQAWQYWDEKGVLPARTAQQPAPTAPSPPTTSPVLVPSNEPTPESTPAPSPAPAAMPAPTAAPARPTTAPGEDRPSAPAPGVKPGGIETRMADAKAPESAAEKGEEQSQTRTYKRYPIPSGSGRAPHPAEISALPPKELDSQAVVDALRQPIGFGKAGEGFQMPDWSQDVLLENIAADDELTLTEDSIHAKGNVRFQMGAMQFSSQTLEYRREPLYVHAVGDVHIVQENSELTADEIIFEAPPEEETGPEAEAPAGVFKTPEDQARQQLRKGTLQATNIHITEPGREFQAAQMVYDFADGTGEFNELQGRADIYFFYAKHLTAHGEDSFDGEQVWVTTCDHEPPHYRLRLSKLSVAQGQLKSGSDARLQLGKVNTPFYLPRWRHAGPGGYPWTLDFDAGRQADIGSYINLGQQFEINPDVSVGPRIYATEQGGTGFGGDLSYDFREKPASRLFRSKGELHGLQTTQNEGYIEWFHRYDYSPDLALRIQAEQWGGEEFYKDFYYDLYRNRTGPRTFANLTYRQPGYIATATVRPTTHGWVSETERLPEATFHLFDRPLLGNLYWSFDTINGFNSNEPYGTDAARSVNVLRLTYDWDWSDAFSVVPFFEAEGAWYSQRRRGGSATGRLSTTTGVTAQTRFHRTFAGRWGFSSFKHVVVPSVTYSYRPDSTIDLYDTPRFDALDKAFGRSRIESKIENIVYGRDAESSEVWQVGRVTLYQGNDITSELQKTEDYEIEVDLRPRPWWGLQFVGERHVGGDEEGLNLLRRYVNQAYEFVTNELPPWEQKPDFNDQFGDFSRILSQVYYDNTGRGGRFNGRLGYAYTRTRDRTFNREIQYGLGYALGEKWGIGIEHIYDLEEGGLRRQTYEIRRSLHEWEASLRVRERESGVDLNLEFSLKAFPGSRLKL